MSQKTYVSLRRLSTFLDSLYTKFATVTHKHTLSNITDYIVDSQLSPTSQNPVQNKVLDAEFEAISSAMNALESAIDNKSDINHTHDSDSFIMTDTVTGAQYNLYVMNGKLTLVQVGEGVITGYEDGDEVMY